MSKNAPVKKIRIGSVTASIWKNSGPSRDWYSVTVERSYKGEGGIENTGSFNHGDLLNLSECVRRAEAWIAAEVGLDVGD